MHTSGSDSRIIRIIYLYLLLVFAQIVMLWSLATDTVQVERMCSYFIMIVCYGLFFLSCIKAKRLFPGDGMILVIICYFLVLSIMKEWKYSNFVSVLTFFEMLTVWTGARFIHLDQKLLRRMCIAFSVQTFLLVCLFFSPLAYKSYIAYVLVSSELTLGFDNPNQTGIIIVCTAVTLFLLYRKTILNKWWKRLLLAEILVLCVMLVLTKARTSMLGGLLFIVYVFFVTGTRRKTANYAVANAILWFPIVFVFLYLALANSKLGDLVFWEKELFSGRERVYKEVLSFWKDKWLGNLSHFEFQNSHNSHLTILVNIGIVGFALYMTQTTRAFNALRKESMGIEQHLCIAAIMMLFVMGCAETAMLTGGTFYYIYLLTFVVLARDRCETTA